MTSHRLKLAEANETWRKTRWGRGERNLLCWKKEPQETSLILIAFLRQVGRESIGPSHVVTDVLELTAIWNLWPVTHNRSESWESG